MQYKISLSSSIKNPTEILIGIALMLAEFEEYMSYSYIYILYTYMIEYINILSTNNIIYIYDRVFLSIVNVARHLYWLMFSVK